MYRFYLFLLGVVYWIFLEEGWCFFLVKREENFWGDSAVQTKVYGEAPVFKLCLGARRMYRLYRLFFGFFLVACCERAHH